jgi:sulfate transport system permease protein
VLALLALVTLALKLLAERHMSAELSDVRDVPAHAGPVTLPSALSASSSAASSVSSGSRPLKTSVSQQHPLKQGEL